MKKGLLLITAGVLIILGYIGSSVSAIWAIVEFILYLVKDHPFNWWSVWLIPSCGLLSIVFSIVTIIYNKPTPVERMNTNKGNFQRRLDELKKQREENK